MVNTLLRAGRLIRTVASPARRAARRRFKTYEEIFGAIESGTVVVHAPQFGGSFEMDCRSHSLKRLLIDGCYETDVVETVNRLVDPNRDAIDVGANIGFFTMLMSNRLSPPNRILAIEPTPGAFCHLRNNIERNQRGNVELFQGVAAETDGEFQINTIAGLEEYSSLVRMVHPSIRGVPHRQITVAGKTIDRLVEEFGLRPGIIKIDTEGAEYGVLAGCEQTMKIHRPVILCEAWPDRLLSAAGARPGSVRELLLARGYVVQQSVQGEILAVPHGETSTTWEQAPHAPASSSAESTQTT